MQKCQLLLSTKSFQIMKLGDNTPNNLTLSLVNWKFPTKNEPVVVFKYCLKRYQ